VARSRRSHAASVAVVKASQESAKAPPVQGIEELTFGISRLNEVVARSVEAPLQGWLSRGQMRSLRDLAGIIDTLLTASVNRFMIRGTVEWGESNEVAPLPPLQPWRVDASTEHSNTESTGRPADNLHLLDDLIGRRAGRSPTRIA
jgi:hypothetical protein